MFGVDTKKIKQAFDEFMNSAEHFNRPSSDPWVQLIVKFIRDLRKAFS